MCRLCVLVILFLSGCAAKPSYIDSAALRPELTKPEGGKIFFVQIREMNGQVKSRLVSANYCIAAVHLATHSGTKISRHAPLPAGRGYLMEIEQEGVVVDRFEFWPTEVVVRGQRWLIEDSVEAARVRMFWFSEFPSASKN